MLLTRLRQIVALGGVAALLLADLSLFDDFFFPIRHLWSQGELLKLFVSITLFLWGVLASFLLFFSGRSLLRTITLPLFLFFYLFNIGYFTAASAPLDFQQADIIVRNFRWFVREALENYGLSVLPILLTFIPAVLFAEFLPRLSKLDLPRILYLVPISAVVLTTIGIVYTNGLFDRYPSFFRVPSMLAFVGLSSVYDGQRSKVDYRGPLNVQTEKIVLIVDESIRADILGVNGYATGTTPYLSSLQTGLVNFGLAAAASNCSDYSNLILRTGVQKGVIPDEDQVTLKVPTIWQFTGNAGYYNVYIDAQSPETSTTYQNFMTPNEAHFIDDMIRVRQDAAYESDRVALEKLAAYLRKPGKTFIMLNKYGIHFPYFRSYPEAFNLYRPALEPGEPMYDRERSLNSFMSGIRWSVDDWFRALLAEREDYKPYVIVYTSDHGQNIVDDGTLATHCRPRATRFEGMVPMMVLSSETAALDRFETVRAASHNRTNHFQVFPTLIELAGYSEGWVKDHYGPSLFDRPDSAPEFFVGDLHGRGSVRRWVSILPTARRKE
jgi:glucan phosphoethanolaminetransferase (alkaline phosphatase superfamily)